MKKKHKHLRILSYNIHQGLTVLKKNIQLLHLKEALKSLNPDILLLQEVAGYETDRRKKTGYASSFQLEALLDKTWPHSAYGKNSIFQGGFHGNAILSKYPILHQRNFDISEKNLIKRGVLHVEIDVNLDKPLHAISTHFGLLQFERQRQLKKLVQYHHKHIAEELPLVIGGDFNDWRELLTRKLGPSLKVSEAHRSLHRKHAKTFPAPWPVLSLDRIYYRGLKLAACHRLKGRPWMFLSDHLPLLSDFEIQPK